jgi:predicted esterase
MCVHTNSITSQCTLTNSPFLCHNNVLQDGVFTETILDAIEANYCVDLKRVFASGFSNGGMFAYVNTCLPLSIDLNTTKRAPSHP